VDVADPPNWMKVPIFFANSYSVLGIVEKRLGRVCQYRRKLVNQYAMNLYHDGSEVFDRR